MTLANHGIGIDVQSELALKGSPHLRPTRPPMAAQASPMQKAMLNRQQGRQRPILAPPLQTVNQPSLTGGSRNFGNSPTVQPTPPSQHSSPATAKSPGFALQGGIASPNSDFQGQTHAGPHRNISSGPRQQQFAHQQQHMRNISASTSGQPPIRSLSQTSGGNYYQPQFQKHYDQLGKYTLISPFHSYPGALFVLGLFRAYRTGIRCTRWYARRSRRRRNGRRQLHSEFQATNNDGRTQWHASFTSNDNGLWKRQCWRRWRDPCYRSIRPHAGRGSIWIDCEYAFSKPFQLSATSAEKVKRLRGHVNVHKLVCIGSTLPLYFSDGVPVVKCLYNFPISHSVYG